MRRFNSDMRPSAVLMGMQSWQRVSPQGWREYNQYWIAPASMPSAMSQRSASLSLSAILLARSTVLEKAASNVSAIGSMGGSIGIAPPERKASICHRQAYVQRGVLLEPQGVDTQPVRTLHPGLEQCDVGDVRHVHEPLSRAVADVIHQDPQVAALFRSQFENPVEAVMEHAIVQAIMRTHTEMQRGIAGIFDVYHQDLVAPPIRHRLVESDPRKFLGAKFHLERVVDDFAFDADAHGPIQLESRMEIGEHRELRIAMHIRSSHPNNGLQEYCDAGDRDDQRERTMPAAQCGAALEHRIHGETTNHTDHIRRHVFP